MDAPYVANRRILLQWPDSDGNNDEVGEAPEIKKIKTISDVPNPRPPLRAHVALAGANPLSVKHSASRSIYSGNYQAASLPRSDCHSTTLRILKVEISLL